MAEMKTMQISRENDELLDLVADVMVEEYPEFFVGQRPTRNARVGFLAKYFLRERGYFDEVAGKPAE